MRALIILLAALLLFSPALPIPTLIAPAHAQEGGDAEGGGDNPRPAKTITLNKKSYSEQDLKDALKAALDGDTVIIAGTNRYGSTTEEYDYHFLSLARTLPRVAAEFLNQWLKAKTYAEKYRAARRARKRVRNLAKTAIRLAEQTPKGSPERARALARIRMFQDATYHVRVIRAFVKQDAQREAQAKQRPAGSPEVFRSDVRLKRDLSLLARLPSGIGIYLYRLRESNKRRIGVIAQEVLEIAPWAVTIVDGWLHVDYGRLFASRRSKAALRNIGLGDRFWRAAR